MPTRPRRTERSARRCLILVCSCSNVCTDGVDRGLSVGEGDTVTGGVGDGDGDAMNRGLGDGVAVITGCGKYTASTGTTKSVLNMDAVDPIKNANDINTKRLICIE
ncbi:MAG: hypothetical protein ABIV21_00455 [Pyrinomonadaceae bacterium]